jgi:hypothetical protein
VAPRPQARPALSPADLLAGRWSVRRELHDRLRGEGGTFTGAAVFTPDGDALRWVERGHLRFARHDGPASRTLTIEPEGDGWVVRFSDGRLFHAFDLATGSLDAVHPCGPDMYRGRYVLETPDRLHVRWDVSGPEADETLEGVYERIASPDMTTSASPSATR